jgi:phospholipid/cholesterol/gamma-HCH transport system substrate-binding protein
LVGRIIVLAAAIVAVAALAMVLLGIGSNPYKVNAIFQDASQLVKGDQVEVAGSAVGSVTSLTLTPDGRARVTMSISDPSFKPLREGTVATIRQASLSGEANRYVELQLPPATSQTIRSGGEIPEARTNSAVELDQLFNTFDQSTRNALSGVIRGYSTFYGGRGAQTSSGFQYLNPALASTTRLFDAVNRDTPLLTRFVVASSALVTDLASRQNDLSGLIDHLATATGAIGAQKQALASTIAQLPAFMRRANTTFVNLRSTIDQLTPLVNESKPVAKKLRPFLAALRPFARDARPTLRDLSALIKNPKTPNSDLISLTNSVVPVRDIAIGPVQANGATREGAFPASTRSLGSAAPEVAFARPYAPDLTGWFDDFSHTGAYDALGGFSRPSVNVNAFGVVNGLLQPIPPALRQAAFQAVAAMGQRNRCPGSAEHPQADGSVPYHPSSDFPCDPSQTLLGP